MFYFIKVCICKLFDDVVVKFHENDFKYIKEYLEGYSEFYIKLYKDNKIIYDNYNEYKGEKIIKMDAIIEIINPYRRSSRWNSINEPIITGKKYRKLKRNAKKNRIQFIQELATQQAERGNETISNAINRINRNEELRESYKRIKTVTKPFFGATEKVLITTANLEEERITTDKLEIEKALCDQNKKKFLLL